MRTEPVTIALRAIRPANSSTEEGELPVIDIRVITAHELFVLQDHLDGELQALIYLDAPARACRRAAEQCGAVAGEVARRWEAVRQSLSV